MDINELTCYLADVFADGYCINIQVNEEDTEQVDIVVDQGNDIHVYHTLPKYIVKKALQEVFDILGE